MCMVDQAVYTKNRAFRMYLSSKFAKRAILLPLVAQDGVLEVNSPPPLLICLCLCPSCGYIVFAVLRFDDVRYLRLFRHHYVLYLSVAFLTSTVAVCCVDLRTQASGVAQRALFFASLVSRVEPSADLRLLHATVRP